MREYKVEITMKATAYINAESEEEAENMIYNSEDSEYLMNDHKVLYCEAAASHRD